MSARCLSPRPLGSSGLEVSALSLGSWRTFEHVPRDTGAAILAAAREEVVVANKLWWEFWPQQSPAAELEASLDRMGFDYVDVIYANPPPESLAIGDLVAAVAGLVSSGKARAWALVNWAAADAAQAVGAAAGLGVPAPCAVQLPYSLVRRSWVEDPVMAGALAAAGAGVVASFCLEGGVLSGKYLPGAAAGRAAGTLGDPRVAPAMAAAGELTALAGELGTTAATLALTFPLTSPAVASVLFGATSPGQLRANCAAAGLRDRLSDSDIAQLRRIGVPRP